MATGLTQFDLLSVLKTIVWIIQLRSPISENFSVKEAGHIIEMLLLKLSRFMSLCWWKLPDITFSKSLDFRH